MTSAHSTRNTSIRTRKIRGEDSLLSSISISEREEGPEGICGVSSGYEKARWRPIWHSGLEKKAGKPRFRADGGGTSSRNPALTSAYFGTVRCPTGIFHEEPRSP